MVGAIVRDNPKRWEGALHRLRNSDLERIHQQFPNYPYPNLLSAIQVSVDAVAVAQRPRYLDLAVFPEDTPIPEATLATLWAPAGLNEFDAQELADLFVGRSLARRDAEGRLTLHDLQADYVRKQCDELPTLHRQLLDGYWQVCIGGWATGPDDSYFFQNLPYHLKQAGQDDELRSLLLDLRWLQAKLKSTDIQSIISDYAIVPQDDVLVLVQAALRLSAHVLASEENKPQLAGQLLARLLGSEQPEIQQMLSDTMPVPDSRIWLRPLMASLMPPVGPLLRVLTGHQGNVEAIAVTPRGERAVSVAYDGLRVWDLTTGQELHYCNQKFSSNVALAISPNGRVAVSAASEHQGVIVWDLEAGGARRTLPVEAIALATDDQSAFTITTDGIIGVWDIESGLKRREFRCDPSPRTAAYLW